MNEFDFVDMQRLERENDLKGSRHEGWVNVKTELWGSRDYFQSALFRKIRMKYVINLISERSIAFIMIYHSRFFAILFANQIRCWDSL